MGTRWASWAPALVFGIAATACTKHETVAIAADPGDLVAIAVVSGSEITRVTGGIVPEVAAELSLADGEELFPFVIRARDLIAEDGQPIAQVMIDALQIARAEDAMMTSGGSCGRCLVPGDHPPMIVHAGDRCSLPSFAATTKSASEEKLARIRAGIVLAWPGECACAPYTPPSRTTDEIELTMVYPASYEPFERATVSESRAVAIFSERFAHRFTPEGGIGTAATSELPFPGPVLAAAGVSGSQFAVVSHDPEATLREARLDLLDSNLLGIAAIEDLDLRPLGARWIAEEDALLLYGTGFSRVPRVMSCATGANPARVDCRTITSDLITGIGENLFDALRMPNGMLIVAAQFGLLVFERVPRADQLTGAPRIISSDRNGSIGELEEGGSVIRWRSFANRILDAQGRELDLEPRQLGHAGDRLYVCATRDQPFLTTSQLDASIFDPATDPPPLRVVDSAPNTNCGGFSIIAGAPDQVRFTYAGGRSAIVDSAGAVVSIDEYRKLPGFEVIPGAITTVVPGVTIAMTSGRQLFRRDDRTGNDTWEQIWGNPMFSEASYAEVLERDGEFFAIGRLGGVVAVELMNGNPIVRELEVTPPLGWPGRINAAALDTERGGFVLAGDTNGAAWIGRATSSFELTMIEIDRELALDDTVISQMSEVAPGTFLFIAEDSRILRMRGDVVGEVPIAWDDPSTPTVEEMPEYSEECRMGELRHVRPERDLLRAIDSAGGVAWIAGCAGTLLRVIPFGDAPIAERVWVARSTEGQIQGDGPPPLTSVAALCADDLAFAARGANSTNKEQGRVWRIATRESVEPIFGSLELFDAEGNMNAQRSTELDSGAPYALELARDRLIPVFWGGVESPGSVHVAGSRSRSRFSDELHRSALDDQGRLLVGSTYGRLVLGLPRSAGSP